MALECDMDATTRHSGAIRLAMSDAPAGQAVAVSSVLEPAEREITDAMRRSSVVVMAESQSLMRVAGVFNPPFTFATSRDMLAREGSC
jgi:hypothetical protein